MINLRNIALWSLVVATIVPNAEALTLTGKVTKDGVPARYARLYLTGEQRPIRTDKTGTFTVTVSSPGTFTITPVVRGNFTSSPLNRLVTVNSSNVTELNFSLTRVTEKATARGRITDAAGAPLSNTAVQISGVGRITTDANGVFVRSGLSSGNYFLSANAAGLTFSPSLRQIKITNGRGVTVNFRGRPLDAGANIATYLSGLYTVSLSRTSGQCAALPSSISGAATVSQTKDRVRVSLPNLGATTLRATSNGFEGVVSKRRLGCTLNGNVKGTYSSQDQAAVTGNLEIVCPGQSNCSGSFVGTLKRQ